MLTKSDFKLKDLTAGVLSVFLCLLARLMDTTTAGEAALLEMDEAFTDFELRAEQPSDAGAGCEPAPILERVLHFEDPMFTGIFDR